VTSTDKTKRHMPKQQIQQKLPCQKTFVINLLLQTKKDQKTTGNVFTGLTLNSQLNNLI